MYIRFVFVSDSVQTNNEGWIIDNINIGYISYGGIDDKVEKFIHISLLPNPSSDKLTVIAIPTACREKQSTVSIYNIQGEFLMQLPLKQEKTQIDISSLANGMYFVKVNTEKGIAVKKFVKE